MEVSGPSKSNSIRTRFVPAAIPSSGFSRHSIILAIVLVVVGLSVFQRSAGAPSVATRVAASEDLPSSGDSEIDGIILEAALRHGVDPRLIHNVIRLESNFRRDARSPRDACGLMQLIPATAQRFAVTDPFDPEQNIDAGTRYLRWLLMEFEGNVELALAGYNAGEGAVRKYGNAVPDYGETRAYVESALAEYGYDYHPVLPPEKARILFGLSGM